MGVLYRHLRHSTPVEVFVCDSVAKFSVRQSVLIFYSSVKGEKVMFITGLYNYTLSTPSGDYISVQSTEGVFDVLRENEGCQFISKTLIGYQSCAMAD